MSNCTVMQTLILVQYGQVLFVLFPDCRRLRTYSMMLCDIQNVVFFPLVWALIAQNSFASTSFTLVDTIPAVSWPVFHSSLTSLEQRRLHTLYRPKVHTDGVEGINKGGLKAKLKLTPLPFSVTKWNVAQNHTLMKHGGRTTCTKTYLELNLNLHIILS